MSDSWFYELTVKLLLLSCCGFVFLKRMFLFFSILSLTRTSHWGMRIVVCGDWIAYDRASKITVKE